MKGMPRIPILIVQDDRSTRNVYRFLLEIAGYATLAASDPSAVIDTLQAHPTGMVALLDWEMPQAGCMRILRGLARTPEAAARHRFVLLARAPDSLHSRLLTLPASFSFVLLRKPAAMDELLAAVGEAARTVPSPPSNVMPAG